MTAPTKQRGCGSADETRSSSSGWVGSAAWPRHSRLLGFSLDDVVDFVAVFGRRRDKAGKNHPDHAFLDLNGLTDFQLWFVRAADYSVAGRVSHVPLWRTSDVG